MLKTKKPANQENGSSKAKKPDLNKRHTSFVAREGFSRKLLTAVKIGSKTEVKKLIVLGADPNVRNYRDETPLILAVKNGDTGIAEFLADNGADVNYSTSDGRSALYIARKNRDIPMQRLLIRKGAKW